MGKQSKNSVKIGLLIVLVASLFTISLQLKASLLKSHHFFSSLTSYVEVDFSQKKPLASKNTQLVDTDTLLPSLKIDSAKKSVRIDTLNISKDSLDAPVQYSAEDSGVLIIPTKEFLLYGKASIKSKDVSLDAATIRYDQGSQLIKAFGALDSSGNPNHKPKMKQGDLETLNDTIAFSLKSLKGLTKNTYLHQDEIYINAKVLKKVSANEYFGYKTLFTTCNLDTPHFAIRARRMKMISNKLAVSGPASPEFEGVPIPIGIPFGIYPLIQGRHSGVLPPAFIVSEDRGFGLEGLGYYKVFNEYWDVVTRSNLYSYGGWTLNVSPKYQKRYRYSGGINLTYQNIKSLNRGSSYTQDEFTVSKSYSINWSHNQDQRVRPGTNFSANVNFSSSSYNKNVLNNPVLNYQNSTSSSISYSKDFRGKGNISLNANHSQNNNTRLYNLSLPTLGANINTFYPFEKKERVGSAKWYEKLGIGYSGNFTNQLSFYDTAFNAQKLLDTLLWGASHSIPISLALPSLGPINISPGVSYSERWYGQKIFRRWNGTKVDTSIKKGFYTAREISFSMSASTRIFGTYLFKNSQSIQAIRHEIRPTIGVSYKPDLASQYFYNVQVDTAGHYVRLSQFEGVIPGAYSEGNFGGINFGIDNLLEMKVKDKADSSKGKPKKIKLVDGFGFSSAYNLLADSFALSPFQLYVRSTLFEKVNITANFTLDPYAVDSLGFKTKKYTWQNGNAWNMGRLTSGSIALSTQFKSKPKDGRSDKERLPKDNFLTPEEQLQQLQYARSNPAEFTDFNIPWSLSVSYSLSFSKQLGADYKFATQINSSINFQGDFSLTEKWKMGSNGYFDFNAGKLQQFSMFVTREMHCWQLAINVTPIGLARTFSVTLSPKSGILRDLRVNRSRTFSNY